MTPRSTPAEADPRWSLLALVAIVAVAALLRGPNLDWGLPDYWIPDEAVHTSDGLVELETEPPEPSHFFYPHFHRYLVGGLTRLVGDGAAPLADQIAIGRRVTALFAVATVLAVYAIGVLLFSRRIALFSAAFLALAPYHATYAHLNTSDAALVFWVCVAMVFAAKALAAKGFAAKGQRTTSGRWLLASGLAAGLAGATRYPGLAAVVPPVWVALFGGLDRRAPPRLRDLALAFAVGAACVAAFAATSPMTLVEWRHTLTGIGEMRHINVVLGGSAPLPEQGWLAARFWYQLAGALPFSLGVPLCLLAYAGLAVMLRRSTREALLLLSFVAPLFLVVGSSRAVFPRYCLPLLPFLCIFAGYAADRLVRTAGWRRGVGLAVVTSVLALTVLTVYGRVSALDTAGRQAVAALLKQRATARAATPAAPATVSLAFLERRYDGLERLLAGERRLRIVNLPKSAEDLAAQDPDFVVVSAPVRVQYTRRRADAREMFRQLDSNELGYELAHHFAGPDFVDAKLFAALDPLLVHTWANGEIGFRVYERERPKRRRARARRATR